MFKFTFLHATCSFFVFFFQGNRLKEATKINLSLSALGNVISALVSKYLLKVIHGDINPF